MRFLLFISLSFFSGCQTLPQLYQATEDIADNTAIKIEISRETFQKETDLAIAINVQNKDEPVIKTALAPMQGK